MDEVAQVPGAEDATSRIRVRERSRKLMLWHLIGSVSMLLMLWFLVAEVVEPGMTVFMIFQTSLVVMLAILVIMWVRIILDWRGTYVDFSTDRVEVSVKGNTVRTFDLGPGTTLDALCRKGSVNQASSTYSPEGPGRTVEGIIIEDDRQMYILDRKFDWEEDPIQQALDRLPRIIEERGVSPGKCLRKLLGGPNRMGVRLGQPVVDASSWEEVSAVQ